MRTYAARWKLAGKLILILGLLYAPVHYVVQSHRAEERLGDVIPDYDKAMNREMRIQMGTLGLVLMQWNDALEQPGTQALLIAVGAGIAAKGCYYIAQRLIENDMP